MTTFSLFRSIVNEQPQQDDDISHLLGGGDEQPQPQQQPQQQDQQNQQQGQDDDISGLLGGDEEGGDPDEHGEEELDQIVDQAASQDPDRQGVIRVVKNAHLVYKRQNEDGGYDELWIYNVGKLQDELEIRKAILAGTDIPPNKRASPDNQQKYEIWSAGNAEVLKITGLPN